MRPSFVLNEFNYLNQRSDQTDYGEEVLFAPGNETQEGEPRSLESYVDLSKSVISRELHSSMYTNPIEQTSLPVTTTVNERLDLSKQDAAI